MDYNELLNEYHELSASNSCLQRKYEDLEKKYKATCDEYEARIINLYNLQGLDVLNSKNMEAYTLVSALNSEIIDATPSSIGFIQHLSKKLKENIKEQHNIINKY